MSAITREIRCHKCAHLNFTANPHPHWTRCELCDAAIYFDTQTWGSRRELTVFDRITDVVAGMQHSSEEATLLRTVIAAPQDEVARLVYQDWLDERGDPRAEFLRLEGRLCPLERYSTEANELQMQLNEASDGISWDWIALVSRVAVESCGGSFGYLCGKRWEDLRATPLPNVRFCTQCGDQVVLCRTIAEGRSHSRQRQGAAFDPRLLRHAGDLQLPMD
jgi:uncharacterized protein (TIGR02996 family)